MSKHTSGELTLRPLKTDHFMPHVPTDEMVKNHPWVVIDGKVKLCGWEVDNVLFTGLKSECEIFIANRERNLARAAINKATQ